MDEENEDPMAAAAEAAMPFSVRENYGYADMGVCSV